MYACQCGGERVLLKWSQEAHHSSIHSPLVKGTNTNTHTHTAADTEQLFSVGLMAPLTDSHPLLHAQLLNASPTPKSQKEQMSEATKEQTCAR